MNVLILGGTRLLGLSIVRLLSREDVKVTVISHKAFVFPSNINHILAEKEVGIALLKNKRFDLVIDFLSYNENDVSNVFNSIEFESYVFISSVWLAKMSENNLAGEYLPDNLIRPKNMLDVTYTYLMGKNRAEKFIKNFEGSNHKSVILRLPIFWGVNEHTGRLDFYSSRIRDGNPIILIDGVESIVQIAWTEDITKALIHLINCGKIYTNLIWEALPHDGCDLNCLLDDIASACSAQYSTIQCSLSLIEEDLPDFLDKEPLWRERKIARARNNIFVESQISPTPQRDWIKKILHEEKAIGTMTNLRMREIDLIKKINRNKQC